MFIRSWFVGLAVFLTTAAFAEGVTGVTCALSFSEFSQKVVAYYPKLKAAHSDVNLALARQMQAKAGFWPTLDLSAGYKVSDDPVSVFGMLMRQERYTASDSDLKHQNTPRRHQDFDGGIHIDLPLFDSMRTIYQARSARENLKASESDEAFTRMEALLVAQDAYLNAVTLEKLFALVDEVQKNSDEDLQKAKDLKDKGMILGADYYSARVMFGDLRRMNNELVRQKAAMRSLLNILMGEAVDKQWSLASTLNDTDISVEDTAELLQTALSHRPDLMAADLRLKAADSDLSQARSTSLPNLSAYGDATNDRNKIASAGGNNFTVGIKAGFSLFDPARAGRMQEAKSRKERLEYDIQQLKDKVSGEIVEEAARYGALRDNLGVFKAMTEDAAEAVSLIVPLYSEGRKSIADVLQMRLSYLRSAQSYHKAVMNAWLSEGRLFFLTGTLTEDQLNQLARGAGL